MQKGPQVVEVAACRSQKTETSLSTGQGADIVILAAIRAGNRSPGTVASETKLGATPTYQLIDKLRAEGRISQARDGELSVVEEEI